MCRERREGRGEGGRTEGDEKSIRGEGKKERGEWKGKGQNEKERRKRRYLSVQAKLVLFNALTHKPERQKNND